MTTSHEGQVVQHVRPKLQAAKRCRCRRRCRSSVLPVGGSDSPSQRQGDPPTCRTHKQGGHQMLPPQPLLPLLPRRGAFHARHPQQPLPQPRVPRRKPALPLVRQRLRVEARCGCGPVVPGV